jgi:membrane-anchored protein YejM (alkaline phosphatase superfamily)
MYRPVALDRTAFASVPDLRITPAHPSAPAWQRDRDMLAEWFDWMDRRATTRPFFGFLFFDASNAQSFPPAYPGQFKALPGRPKAGAFAAYRSAIHFDDALVAQVLADLRERGVEDRTVVLVTSDHGEEFMESGPEFDDHGSGYSRYQLQVPMLISWPGKAPGTVNRRTSHYDVAATLLHGVLGCSNDAADYSSGADLFQQPGWDWLVAGSYYNYAVLEPDQITVTFPNGLYEVRDWDYRIVDQPEFRGEVLRAVMQENRRFHR